MGQSGLSLCFATGLWLAVSSSVMAATSVTDIYRLSGENVLSQTVSNPGSTVVFVKSNAQSSLSATTTVAMGSIKLRATGAVSGGDSILTASGEFNDHLTFANASLNGKRGFAVATVFYNWDISTQAAGGSGASGLDSVKVVVSLGAAQARVAQTKQTSCLRSGECVESPFNDPIPVVSGSAVSVSAAPFSYFTTKLPITFGRSLLLDVYATTDISLYGYGTKSASALTDASHSVYWGGISSVTDSSGNPVEYSLLTASGSDLSRSFAPVPEPSTIALLSAGVLLIGLRRHRKRAAAGLVHTSC